jgi:hypothetical protein
MRSLKFIFLAILFATLVTSAIAQKRFVPVVGNDRYENLPAPRKAVNDARAVGERFARLRVSAAVQLWRSSGRGNSKDINCREMRLRRQTVPQIDGETNIAGPQ